MTTATVMDPEKHKEDKEFAYGSGQLNPAKAIDPGLIFNISESEYINFLCKQGYNTTTLRLLTGDQGVCNSSKHGRGSDLNYPSFPLAVEDRHGIDGFFTRKVTNVGSPSSTYHAEVYMSEAIRVKVEPSVLSFSTTGEEKSFTVKITGPKISKVPIISCSLTWKDGVLEVRSPVVVYTTLPPSSSTAMEEFKRPKKLIPGYSLVFKNRGIFGRN